MILCQVDDDVIVTKGEKDTQRHVQNGNIARTLLLLLASKSAILLYPFLISDKLYFLLLKDRQTNADTQV